MVRIKPKKFEVLILAGIVLVLLVWILFPRGTGGAVQVSVDGNPAGTYSLMEAQRIPIEGYGDYHLELVIENGAAHVENASCPDLICQNHTAIQTAGQQIVCLPGRIVIKVMKEQAEEGDDIDAVVG